MISWQGASPAAAWVLKKKECLGTWGAELSKMFGSPRDSRMQDPLLFTAHVLHSRTVWVGPSTK